MSTDVVVEKVGNRIHLYSEWFPGVNRMCKEVPGASWAGNEDKGGKYWTYPLQMMVCRALRETFHDMLVIGPELEAWARLAKQREKATGALGRQADAELLRVPEIAPRMAAAMANRRWQRVGARFIAEGRQVGLFDEPSLGKTIQYYGGLMEAGEWHGTHLIAAPVTSLETVWYDQAMRWCDDAAVFHMPQGRAKREERLAEFALCPLPAKFLVINPEMLQTKLSRFCKKCNIFEEDLDEGVWPDEHHQNDHKASLQIYEQKWPELFQITWDSVMVDEADRWTIGIRAPQVGKRTQAGEGLMRLRVKEDGVRVASTGTPMHGKIKNLWGTFHFLRPDAYSSVWAWREHWLEISDNGFGKRIGDLREERVTEFYEELDGFILRRTKAEVQPELPAKNYEEVWVRMDAKQAKQYEVFSAMGEAELEGGHIQGTGVLSEITRLRQFAFGEWKVVDEEMIPTANSPKIHQLLEMLYERGVTGKAETDHGDMKFTIASQFTKIVDLVETVLNNKGIATLKITGAVSQQRRTEAVHSFNSPDGPRVMLVNTKAGGSAIDLDQRCDEMFILDETNIPDYMEQLEGRINNRSGRIAPRFYWYIRTRDTIEESIAEDSADADTIAKTLLDGRRGVAFALRLIRRDHSPMED